MAPFESELPKFVNDPRYHGALPFSSSHARQTVTDRAPRAPPTAVKTQRDRRDLFDQFCKNKIREQRAAKKRAAESGVKLDVRGLSHLCTLPLFTMVLTNAVSPTPTAPDRLPPTARQRRHLHPHALQRL